MRTRASPRSECDKRLIILLFLGFVTRIILRFIRGVDGDEFGYLLEARFIAQKWQIPFMEYNVGTVPRVKPHLYDTNKIINECHRVLKSGGILILTLPNYAWWKSRLKTLLGLLPEDVENPLHYKHFNWWKIVKFLSQNGFEVVERVRCGELIERLPFTLFPLNWARTIFVVARAI